MRIKVLIRNAFKLQVHKVERVCKGTSGVLEIHLERNRRRYLFCGNCGQKAPYRDRRKERRWHDLYALDQPMVVVYAPCRVSCRSCGVRVEAMPWAFDRARVTRRLANQVAIWTRKLCWKDAAELFRINWKSVVTIVQYAVNWGLKHRKLKPVHYMGQDEVCSKKGHKYLTTFWDLKRKVLLWVGEDRTEATVKAFFTWFGKRRARTLKAVCMDMWKPYMNVVREMAPKAVLVFDRFHLVAHLNEAVDTVRRQIMAKAQGTWADLIRGTRYLWITHSWNLQPGQKLQLRGLLKLNTPLVKAYVLKEAFHKFWNYIYKGSAKKWLKNWCRMAMYSRLEPLKKFARMVRSHEKGILAWVDIGISNGTVEGMNNKIGLVKRRAFGFRKTEYLKLAIYHCCANLPLPPV